MTERHTLADAWRAVLRHVCSGHSCVDMTCRSLYAEALMAGKEFEDWFDDVSGRPADENRPPEWAIRIIRKAKPGAIPVDGAITAIERERSHWKELGVGRVARQALDNVRERITLAAPETESLLAVENRRLREMLALLYAGPALYTDDGELQDATMHPFIDFCRDPVEEIRRKIEERAENRLRLDELLDIAVAIIRSENR